MAWIFEAPPSPFQTKLPSGTPINWLDPCSSRLLVAWPVNEGQGTCLVAQGIGNQNYKLRWGADTAIGTGAFVPRWETHDGALALYLPIGVPTGANLQLVRPALNFGVANFPLMRNDRGMTWEFFGQFDGDPTVTYGLMGLAASVSGEFANLFFNNNVSFITSGSGGPVSSAAIAAKENYPNHIVVTVTARGVTTIYGKGQVIASGTLNITPDEFNTFRVLQSNSVLQAQFCGWFYKASFYPFCMGPAGVQALAENPMRVFLSTDYPGVFASDALEVYQAYQLLEYVDGVVPPTVPSYPPPPETPPQTTPPGTTSPPPRTPPVTPGFAPGFRLFQRDTEIRVKPWGSTESYTIARPFGGKSFTGGSDGGAGGADI